MTAVKISSAQLPLAWATSAQKISRSFSRPKLSSRHRSKPKASFSKRCRASAWERADDLTIRLMNNDRRVVITGIGVVTPVGNDLETFWTSLKEGKSGIDRITAFDISNYDCKIAGEVRNFDPKPVFKNPKDVRRTDRFVHLAMGAAKMSIQDSGLDLEKVNR